MAATTRPKHSQQAILYYSDSTSASASWSRLAGRMASCARRAAAGRSATSPTSAGGSARRSTRAVSSPSRSGPSSRTSPIGLDKWFVAIWLIANAKNGISSYEIHRAIGVTQKTAWFMLHRIRLAMQTQDVRQDRRRRRSGRDVHRRQGPQHAHGASGSASIKAQGGSIGQGGRDGHLWSVTAQDGSQHDPPAQSSEHAKRGISSRTIREHVDGGANVYTDALPSYDRTRRTDYAAQGHRPRREVRRRATSTRTACENFWSLLKRAHQRHLRQRRAVPPVPLSGRAGVPLQHAQGERTAGGSRT